MRCKQKIIVVVIGCVVSMLSTSAQSLVSIPYYCGFEDTSENAKWVLNYGADAINCADQWIVDKGARSEGSYGLYISTDGYSASYGVNPNIVVAYREFMVPKTMRYDISFDWKNAGYAGKSTLYMILLDSRQTSTWNPPLSNSLSGIVPNSVRTAFGTGALSASSQWKNSSVEQNLRANTAYRIVFVWTNANTDTLVNPIGACIDNIQIASTNCPKPENMKVTLSCDTSWISWQGYSERYEVQYKLRNNMRWQTLGVQMTTSLYINNLSEGLYDFRVRGICNSDTSAWLTKNSVVNFCAEEHCVNYVNLSDTSVVEAYYGTFDNPKSNIGVVDMGADDASSRHTVYWIQDEFDPRTGSRLRTVPTDEFASVRLGNWLVGKQAESLAYKFKVDSSSSIILLKYAVVLEDPGHGDVSNPRFTMTILDEWGSPIDPTCGYANFAADRNREGWYSYGNVTWKDWTVVGLNLSHYAGRTLQIELTSRDCNWGGHYGYAYFTLGCASAAIETNSCGDNPQIEIMAPDGFNYLWYNQNRPGEYWTTKKIDIDATDTTTYYCDVCYKEDTTCCFTLYTSVSPRFPIADFTYDYVAEDCQNKLVMKNKSHILTRYNGIDVHTSKPCEQYLWQLSDGQQASITEPTFIVGNEGGTLQVHLYAYIADGQCVDDTILQIEVPAIGPTIDTVFHDMCAGDVWVFGTHMYGAGGTYFDTVPSKLTGCDSITVGVLKVHPQYDMPAVVDTICFGETYSWAGREYAHSDTIETWLVSQYGCDSIVTLQLTVLDEINFTAVGTDVLNGPNSGKIELTGVDNTYTYSLNGALNAPLDNLAGGVYTVIVYNSFGCMSVPAYITINQECLSVQINEIPDMCADDQYMIIDYDIIKGYPTTYDVLFGEAARNAGFQDLVIQNVDGNAIQIPLPDGVRPDDYEVQLHFKDVLCEDLDTVLSFSIHYASSVMAQKWNNVLAIYNSKYNGGYTFSEIQWYKNGEPIQGETASILHIADSGLDFGAAYTVELTRKDDGKTIVSCPFYPAFKENVSISPLVLDYTRPVTWITTNQPLNIYVYDIHGSSVKTEYLSGNQQYELRLPSMRGLYTVYVQSVDNSVRQSYKILIR